MTSMWLSRPPVVWDFGGGLTVRLNWPLARRCGGCPGLPNDVQTMDPGNRAWQQKRPLTALIGLNL